MSARSSSPGAPALPRWRRRRTWLGVAALALGVLATRGVAHSDAVSTRLRAALAAAARAHGLELSCADAALSWSGAVALDELELGRDGVRLTAARALLRPDWWALVHGERRLARAELRDVDVSLDLPALERGLRRAPTTTTPTSAGPATPIEVEVDELALRLEAGGGLPRTTLAVTSLVARLRGGRGQRAVEASLRLPAGGAVRLTGSLDDDVDAVITLADVRPSELPRELRDRLPPIVEGSVSGRLELEGSLQLRRGRLAVRLVTSDLVVGGGKLSTVAVGPLPLELTAAVRWSRDERRVYLEEAKVAVGPRAELTLAASGDARLSDDGPVHARLVLDAPDMAALVAALPAAVRPSPAVPALAGPLAGEVTLEGPWQRPLDWEVQGKLDLARMRAIARKSPPAWLQQSFELRAQDGEGREQAVLIGPESPDFVPLADLPAHVADAVVTSEDGGFFGHQGFDFDEIKRSLVAVAEASGRAVRGGSTISQQLAKNLFLSREKTYVRKAREALVTLALESTLPKQRLLEIYLNVIEWGPGIRGIGPAARTYFGKSPRELTPREAAYLASVIPNPVRYFAQYERGEVSAEWGNRLDTILTHMTLNGRLAAEAYAEALRAPIVFHVAD